MTSGGPRKGAGRKPLPKKQKRSIAVQVRLTAVEKKRLDARVRELGTTCGSYLYMLLMEDEDFRARALKEAQAEDRELVRGAGKLAEASLKKVWGD